MNDRSEQLELLRRAAGLTNAQRLILWLYSVHPTDRAGTVQAMGQELAEILDMSESVFSRTRRQLIDLGWLEESERLGRIRYYRLSPQMVGKPVVIRLPTAAQG